ncbi:MAG TPA: CDP-alcohol phosphatidyltransferase family protein [Tepidisphaeraceae bacterium]|jgi:phosphatidylglycerophosphate synthase
MSEQPIAIGERRPVAARDRHIFQVLAAKMAHAGITPNSISVAGMFCGIAAGAVLVVTPYVSSWEQRLAYLSSAIFIQLRLLANMLDGMVAVDSCARSPVGGLYNEIPDRVSDAGTLIGAGLAIYSNLLVGLAATSVAIFVAYVRAQAKVCGAPQDFCGPMAKQHRMALMTIVLVYLTITPQFLQPLWDRDGLIVLALWIIIIGGTATAIRRLIRAARALRNTSV